MEDPIIKDLNNKLDIHTKETIKLSIGIGIIIGFLIGLVASSFLHKYIVHPLGY